MNVRTGYRRILVLFLATVLLPCILLVVTGVRSARQERELSEQRAAEARIQATAQVRQTLLSRLDSIKARAASPTRTARQGSSRRTGLDSSIRLIAGIADGQLLLPWDAARAADLTESEFQRRMKRGEAAEFSRTDRAAALAAFGEALKVARDGRDTALARLALARNRAGLGQRASAREEYSRVLTTSAAVIDDAGIPFSLYAASAMWQHEPRAVIEQARSFVRESCCMSAEAAFMLRDVIDSLAQSRELDVPTRRELTAGIARIMRVAAQSMALKNQFKNLGLQVPARGSGSKWTSFGDEPWFIGISAEPDTGLPTIVAVDAATVIEDLNRALSAGGGFPGRVSLVTRTAHAGGSPLGPDLPAVEVNFPASVNSGGLGKAPLYLGMLIVVLGATAFGASLLWLDVRRELKVAQLRSDFVSSVSHELKTPLTAIRMFAESLLLDADAKAETQREYLGTIVHESERLTRLLNNVLDFSSMEQGSKTFRLETVTLERVLERAARTMEYPLAQHGLKLKVAADTESASVMADEDALQQAVLNLLANAMKFSPRGAEIYLSSRIAGDEAVVEVRDRGPGIPKAYLGRVTEKFFRVPGPESGRVAGTGLGLTLVDHIVRAHRGRLEISSENGSGTLVRMYFPAVPA